MNSPKTTHTIFYGNNYIKVPTSHLLSSRTTADGKQMLKRNLHITQIALNKPLLNDKKVNTIIVAIQYFDSNGYEQKYTINILDHEQTKHLIPFCIQLNPEYDNVGFDFNSVLTPLKVITNGIELSGALCCSVELYFSDEI